MIKLISALLGSLLALSGQVALASTNSPNESKDFSGFFRAITNGNHRYRGIDLEAPTSFQQTFLSRYSVATWVGDQARLESTLIKSGADLWGDWYKTAAPFRFVLPNENQKLAYTVAYNSLKPKNCVNCRSVDELWSVDWKQWSVEERGFFATTYVLHANIFAGRRMIDFVSDNYNFSADEALAFTDVKILSHGDFVIEVREMGWKGEIYFRGITGAEPKNPQRIEILLDADYLRERTEETVPMYQMLEFVGILTHELNHVFQTLDSRRLGFDLQIKSMEGALLIEGGAEYLAERAMLEAASAGNTRALGLYSLEQAIGVMTKDAEKDYQFLPYKVGLPLMYSVYSSNAQPQIIRSKMYETISGGINLSAFMNSDFY